MFKFPLKDASGENPYCLSWQIITTVQPPVLVTVKWWWFRKGILSLQNPRNNSGLGM